MSILLIISVLIATAIAHRRPQCGLGRFFTGSSCELCPTGTYNEDKAATSCTPCPTNTYNPFRGAQYRTVCTFCPPDSISMIEGASSIAVCKKCPRGQIAYSFGGICRPKCPPGRIAVGRKKCLVCSQLGEYAQNNECLRCPPFTSTLRLGASTLSDCVPCPPRTEFLFGRCVPCNSFSFGPPSVFNEKTGTCQRCPPGTFSNRSETCIPCGIGTISTGLSLGSCTPCPDGFGTKGAGASFCIRNGASCPVNFFVKKNGDCVLCSKGSFVDERNEKCVVCPNGSVSDGRNVKKCTACRKGKIPNFRRDLCICGDGTFLRGTRCVKCPIGTFKDISNIVDEELECMKCNPGQVARRGSVRCEKCKGDTVAEGEFNSKCKTCRGKLIAKFVVGQMRCVVPETDCPPGDFRGNITFPPLPRNVILFVCQEVCKKSELRSLLTLRCVSSDCKAGERSGRFKNSCVPCEDEETSMGGRRAQCVKCGMGMVRSDKNGNECVCEGRFAAGKEFRKGECRKCRAGSFNNGKGRGVAMCPLCPAGTFSKKGARGCENCAINTFTNKAGSSSCEKCPDGRISYGVGDTGCVRLLN